MVTSSASNFKQNYERHLKHLRLKGLQPKTISAYSRAIRRIGAYFEHEMLALPVICQNPGWWIVNLRAMGRKHWFMSGVTFPKG